MRDTPGSLLAKIPNPSDYRGLTLGAPVDMYREYEDALRQSMGAIPDNAKPLDGTVSGYDRSNRTVLTFSPQNMIASDKGRP